MSAPIRLGAVEYLNARPLVHGLEQSPLFSLRFDVPSRCAELLHDGAIDLGLISSIEYLRGAEPYAIVPDLAIASEGPVVSVAIYTTRPPADIRSIALDTSSRTGVALTRVFCARMFGIQPALEHRAPDLVAMLRDADAALIIGDKGLLQGSGEILLAGDGRPDTRVTVEKLDLGELWTMWTGLPFVYACWVGRRGVVGPEHVRALQSARDQGLQRVNEVAADYFRETPELQPLGTRYLRDNIKYGLGPQEQAGLERFFRYAEEIGVVDRSGPLTFFDASPSPEPRAPSREPRA